MSGRSCISVMFSVLLRLEQKFIRTIFYSIVKCSRGHVVKMHKEKNFLTVVKKMSHS